MGTKKLVIVGGANGSGKTTFAEEYANRNGYRYLGADAIAVALSPNAPDLVAVAAGREFVRRVNAAIAGSDSLVIESTLAGRTLRRMILAARAAGFAISIVYLFVDSEDICVRRVHERAQKGGHSVPETDVRRRFGRSLRNFWTEFRPLADQWLLVYNGCREPLDVAAGTAADFSIRDAQLFALFESMIVGNTNG